MTDKKQKENIRKILDVKKMLKTVVDHFNYIPTDPYYKDITKIILDRAEKLIKVTPRKSGARAKKEVRPIVKCVPRRGWAIIKFPNGSLRWVPKRGV